MSTQLLHAARERADEEEIKKPIYQPLELDDSMSEWERARHQSKTWSMEQD